MSSPIDFLWGVEIALRDGAKLNATLYRPLDGARPLPCIVAVTPYICDRYHRRGVYFASNGWPFLTVDVRGRGNSQGTFRPYIQESEDGYDVIEWVANQPWCNGQVALWGGSYAGYAQWTIAATRPPHLATLVPVAAPYLGLDFPMRNNVFYPYLMQWIMLTAGKAAQDQLFTDEAFWAQCFRRWWTSGRPFRELDAMLGNASAQFQEWLSHPEVGPFWDAHNPKPEQYRDITIPILSITGSYDDDQPGALEHYRQHLQNAADTERAPHYLIIGPWDHYRCGTPQLEFGGLRLGPESLLDLQKLHLQWYAWALQGAPKPDFLRKPVAYYVMGAERWRYAQTLEEITDHHQRLFLDSEGSADELFAAGSLSVEPGRGAPDIFTYDPRISDGPEVPAESRVLSDSLVDTRVHWALGAHQLIYHSAPFDKNTEVSGFFEFAAWIAIDCPDTDLYVSVFEITEQGTAIRLSTDVMRARYREGLRIPKLIATTEPLLYDFQRFTFVSRLIRCGHRLRLIIAPIGRAIQARFTQRNFNAGGVVAEESAAQARRVTVRLYHDAERPTVLKIPIGRPIAADEPTVPAAALQQAP